MSYRTLVGVPIGNDHYSEPYPNVFRDRTRKRITRRLLPFLLLLFLLAFLDRTNVAVAGLGMKDDLVHRRHPRHRSRVFPRLLPPEILEPLLSNGAPANGLPASWSRGNHQVSWALSACPSFSSSTPNNNSLQPRFILGLAEAGFFPGVIVYLSHWFLYEDRAKTKSMFLIGIWLLPSSRPHCLSGS